LPISSGCSDIGGLIVIDFIDMERAAGRERVMEALEKAPCSATGPVPRFWA
jgi:hypothetical protein